MWSFLRACIIVVIVVVVAACVDCTVPFVSLIEDVVTEVSVSGQVPVRSMQAAFVIADSVSVSMDQWLFGDCPCVMRDEGNWSRLEWALLCRIDILHSG